MAIPKNIDKQNIYDALADIDKDGVPLNHQSYNYDLVTDDGKKYPPKYVIAVANKIVNKVEISTSKFNSPEANTFLKSLGFCIENKKHENIVEFKEHEIIDEFSKKLIQSKNVIFHGAPGTGKTYLAKQIAAYIISGNQHYNFCKLTDNEKKQFEFVQFHPSYDYTDFVEGLRPNIHEDGTMGFSLQDGVFKRFITRARNDESSKKYVFVIDEINRGEISKIFGELFFTIDPGYRGKSGEISTQYSNLHANPDEKFYIPDNVYIIGTMNDIDRSVDSFDFAMRRRFRFIEIKADTRLEMLYYLNNKDEAIFKMNELNKVIATTDGLNANYQIGPAYFTKLNNISYDELWDDYLKPLLHDYIQGMYDEVEIMKSFENAYYNPLISKNEDENSQN